MGRVHASQAFRFLLYLYDARYLKKINFNFNNNLNLDQQAGLPLKISNIFRKIQQFLGFI